MRFSLTHASFLTLTEAPVSLRVRIFKVVGDAASEQEGEDKTFPIDTQEQHNYRLDGVRLGMKEFLLEVLNANAEVIGEGRVRHLVKPGAQHMEERIEIKLHDPTRRRRDVPVEFFVALTGVPGQENKTTYLDVRPIFQRNCLNCHAATSQPEPGGGLVLSAFPFVSRTFTAQDDIVRDLLKWVTALEYPMPPPPNARVPAADVAAIRKWADDGLPAAPVGSDDLSDLATEVVVHYQMLNTDEKGDLHVARGTEADHPFKGVWPNVVISGKYDLSIDVMARDGTLTQNDVMAGHLVDETNDLQMTCNVPYTAPSIDIPVVITP